jgi:hypothetical protein
VVIGRDDFSADASPTRLAVWGDGPLAVHPVRDSTDRGDRVGRLHGEVEFLSPADRCPVVVHAELGVDVRGVGEHGVQGHREFEGDVRPAQIGSQQPKNLELALTQRFE